MYNYIKNTKKIDLSKSFNVRIREQAIKKTILKIESWISAFDSAVRFSYLCYIIILWHFGHIDLVIQFHSLKIRMLHL